MDEESGKLRYFGETEEESRLRDDALEGGGGRLRDDAPEEGGRRRRLKRPLPSFFPWYDEEDDPLIRRRWLLGLEGDPQNDPYVVERRRRRKIGGRGEEEEEERHLSPFERKGRRQRRWFPPKMVVPERPASPLVVQDVGAIESDAELYVVQEKGEDGPLLHTFLKMPSRVPPELLGPSKGPSEKGPSEEGPSEEGPEKGAPEPFYNIVMVDTSASMASCWGSLVEAWNECVGPALRGRTRVYTFGDDVVFRRSGTSLGAGDLSRGGTDLTGALQALAAEVYSCGEASVRAFLLTDGAHNASSADPGVALRRLPPTPKGKVCDVYVVGVGVGFPAGHGVALRRRLHSGTSNAPSVFWARSGADVGPQLALMASEVASRAPGTLGVSPEGAALPGEAPLRGVFHVGEWAYFGPESADDVARRLRFRAQGREGRPALRARPLPLGLLLDVVRQWNNVALQGRFGGDPKGFLPLAERLFEALKSGLEEEAKGVALALGRRLARKALKGQEAEFRALVADVRALLTEEELRDDLSLAEGLLSTTVVLRGRRGALRALETKGHQDAHFREDALEFSRLLEAAGDALGALEVPEDDLCPFLGSSTLSDLKDPDFGALLLRLHKFEFLKEFALTGIPVDVALRDHSSLDPWSLRVDWVPSGPFGVVSEAALRRAADEGRRTSRENQVLLVEGDLRTRCNAVVPVFPKEALKALGPLMRTRLFASCASFCVLRNPHVVDFQVHLAALASTWAHIQGVKGGLEGGPELLGRLEGTAGVYLLREGASSFFGPPSEAPKGAPSRFRACPSLLKPLFLLALDEGFRAEAGREGVDALFGGLLVEFVGRMASKRGPRAPPLLVLRDLDQVLGGPPSRAEGWALLGAFDTPEGLRKWARRAAPELASRLLRSTGVESIVAVDPRRLEGLREPSGLGWRALRAVGARLGVPDALFGPRRALEYAALGLLRRRRLREAPPPPEDPVSGLLKEGAPLRGSLVGAMRARFGASWLRAFREAHQEELALPLTLREAALEAPDASFGASFRRRLGLVAGACQCPKCPHFLLPKRRFNQHASVGRRSFAPLLREGERRAFLREEEEGRPFAHRLHALAFAFRHSRDLGQALSCLLKANPGKKFSPDHLRTIEGHLRGLQTIYREMAPEEGHEGHIEDNKTVDQGPPN